MKQTKFKLVEELAGILTLLQKWQGKSIDQIIETAKAEYFTKLLKEFNN